MTAISIVKIVVPTLVLVAASGVALVIGLSNLRQVESSQTAPVALMAAPSQPAPSAAAAARSESPSVLASAENEAAGLAAELSAPPPAPAKDQSLPAFDLARIEETGDAVIAGRAAPGAVVDLLRNGERLDQAVADASGQFVMVPRRLPAGSYELTLSARLPDGTLASSRQNVTVALKEAEESTGAVQPRAASIPETVSQTRLPDQPDLHMARPQASPPTQAVAARSVSEEGPSRLEVAPQNASKNGTRVVSRGDSLWRISRITYGAGEQYAIVYRANRDQIRNPNLIRPGQILVLPRKGH